MADGKVRIELVPNGPAKVTAESAEIKLSDGTTEEKSGTFSLCRCGQSQKKPYCDGTHKTCGFEG